MGRISSGTGLVSGINTTQIIDQLMALESQPKTLLQARIQGITQQKSAYSDLVTRLGGLKTSATTLGKAATFETTTATSSDEKIITATSSTNAATGSFQFQVARLVSSQQSVTEGFADVSQVKVGAGTLTLEAGGGELSSHTPLSQLNG